MLSVIYKCLKCYFLLFLLTGAILFLSLPTAAQSKPVSAASRQQILSFYQLIVDSLRTQKSLPFAVKPGSFSAASLEQARLEIWKGNLQPVRTYLLHALQNEDVVNNPSLYVAAQSVWVDYLIGVDSFLLSYSQAVQLATYADSAGVKNAGLAYIALARAASYVNETYANAYKNVEKTLAIATSTGDLALEGKAQLVAGTLARKYFYGSSGRSIPYYDKAIAAAIRAKDTPTIIRALILKQDDLSQAGKMEEGLPFYDEAIRVAIRAGYRRFTSNICEGLYFKLIDIEERDKATQMLLYALNATKQFGMTQSETHMYIQLSEMYTQRQMYDSSLYYIKQCTHPQMMVPGGKTPQFFKADIYFRTGKYKEAAELYNSGMDEYLRSYIVHGQDELNRWETTLRTQEKEAEIQSQEVKRKQLNWIICGVLAVLVLSLSALLWQRSLRKRLAAQNRLISRQSKKLEQSLAEKEVLLKEIHHRVKNNLQVIDSLLDMHQSKTELAEAQQESFTKARTHVHTISMIHQNLYQQDHLSSVDMRSFVSELFTQTEKIFNKSNKEVVFQNRIEEDSKLDIDTAVPLGLILNELLTNSFKYVLPNVPQMQLSINISRGNNTEQYLLLYEDNGPGLFNDFNIKKDGSMGMQLIRQLSRQIGGKAIYTYNNGSQFIIEYLTLQGRKALD